MADEPATITRLRELVATRSTGELVCAGMDLEAHVYLQCGRIAWCTSSLMRFAFARHLVEHCRIDAATLHDVVEDCRRHRRPLGETLIEWKLADVDAVRAALREQIVSGLRSLESAQDAQAVFMRRDEAYASYDARLTFDWDEVWSEVRARAVVPSRSPASSMPPRLVAGTERDLAQHVLDSAPGALWAEVRRAGVTVVRVVPEGAAPPEVSALDERALGDDVDFAALRFASCTVAGRRVQRDVWVWCAMESGSPLGVLMTAIEVPSGASKSLRPAAATAGAKWTEAGDAPGKEAVLEHVSRAQGVLAVALLHDDREWRAWRDGEEARARAATAVRAACLDRPSGSRGSVSRALDDAFPSHSMVLGLPDAWCFASQLGGGARRTAWLATDRAMAQGLGWALLASCLRRLAPPDRSSGTW